MGECGRRIPWMWPALTAASIISERISENVTNIRGSPLLNAICSCDRRLGHAIEDVGVVDRGDEDIVNYLVQE